MSDAVKVTDEQARVIAHRDGPALVLAVAGAGKTTTLCLRARALIDAGVSPNRILVTTFSKGGAADMERRAARLQVSCDVRFSTLHSVAYQVLREAPTKRRLTVPTSWQLREVATKALERIAEERGRTGRNKLEGLPKLGDVLREVGLAKAALVWPDIAAPEGEPEAGAWTARDGRTFPAYQVWATRRERDPADPETAEVAARVYAAIEIAARAPEAAGFAPETAGRAERWVSFDDMLALVARGILREEKWVRDWKGRFSHVLLDETQDNNLAQWVMVEHIARDRNLMAVGDDQQSIFGFRGAQPALMREFLTRHGDATVMPLSFNFRCGQEILDAANALLEHATDRLYPGTLQRGRGPEAVGDVSIAAHGTAAQEAEAVVEQVAAAIRDGENPDEIAVLYRLNASAGPFEMGLIRRGIPYRIAGSSFFRRDEVRAAVGYLAAALSETDEDGWARCCNAPTRYLGREFLKRYPTAAAAREAAGLNELGRWRAGALQALRTVDDVRAKVDADGPAAALKYLFEEARGDAKAQVGLRKHFRARGASDETETETDEACQTTVGLAMTLAVEAGNTPAGRRVAAAKIVEYAREMARTGREEADGDRDGVARVTLSTIHRAKGLEWRRVFAAGWSDGIFPVARASMDEERRLGYVALTRAKDYLAVSYALASEDGRAMGPSALVEEARLLQPEATA